MSNRSVKDKVANWYEAYRVLREELTPQESRALLSSITPDEGWTLPYYVKMASVIMANDRCAATVAALLTQTGIKPTTIEYGEESE
jgi:hypothetical protein